MAGNFIHSLGNRQKPSIDHFGVCRLVSLVVSFLIQFLYVSSRDFNYRYLHYFNHILHMGAPSMLLATLVAAVCGAAAAAKPHLIYVLADDFG